MLSRKERQIHKFLDIKKEVFVQPQFYFSWAYRSSRQINISLKIAQMCNSLTCLELEI